MERTMRSGSDSAPVPRNRRPRRPNVHLPASRLLAVRREVAGALVSVAGLAMSPVPGLIVRVGQRRTWLHVADVARIDQREVRLTSTRFDLKDVTRREGELQLLGDVIDHQLVDVHGVRAVSYTHLTLP